MILYSNIYPTKSERSVQKNLLILHGFLGMSDNWKSLAVQFAENGFNVHALDLRNHGKSFQTDNFNYNLMIFNYQAQVGFSLIQNNTFYLLPNSDVYLAQQYCHFLIL